MSEDIGPEQEQTAERFLEQLFGGGDRPHDPLSKPEPSVREALAGVELPPPDKPFSDYTDEDWRAVNTHYQRRLKQREEESRQSPPDDSRLREFGYGQYQRQKADRNAALVRSLHPDTSRDEHDSD